LLRHYIRFDRVFPKTGDFVAIGVVVHDQEDHRLHRYIFSLSWEKQLSLHRYGLQFDGDDDPALLDILLRWGISRLETQLAQDPPDWVVGVTHTEWRIADEDLEELAAMARGKTCEYQLREGRTLLCSAADPNDQTAIGRVALKLVAPTSDGLCKACELPDSQYLCSHLVNPTVLGIATDAGIAVRRCLGAMCNRGYEGAATQPGRCKPGGHRCWERLVELSQPGTSDVAPLSLVVSLDYLDATWRAAPWTTGRLFVHKHAETIADLAQPCMTRADFRDRVAQLDAVLKTMDVPDDPSFRPAVRAAGPLVRLKHSLISRDAQSAAEGPSTEDIESAIDLLLSVNRLRTAIQHPATTGVDLVRAHAVLGIPYPAADWATAWRTLQQQVVSALTRLARQIDALS
jgi:hypothetical protein